MSEKSGLMQGKRGVILGVANNRSIAWGIAKACHDAGAEIALTWQGDALKKRVEPLAKELDALLLGHCDVTDAVDHRRGVRGAAGEMGQDRLRGARDRVLRQGPARRPLSRDHGREFLQDHADQLLLADRDRAARREALDGRRLDPDADLLRRREVDAALQRDGRRESGAGSQRALSRRRSRREEHPRQRDLGRSDQDAGRVRHRRFPLHAEVERVQLADAPQRYDRGGRRQRAVSVVRSVARRHRRGASRRFRLSRRRHEAARGAGYLALDSAAKE